MDTPAKTVSFLHLPPEIRNQIYHHVLSETRGIFLNNLKRPALTRTCRQIQQEALPVFFSSNCFELHLSRPFSGQDSDMLLRPWTSLFLQNVHTPHIFAINVYAIIRYKLWNGFFTMFQIRVLRGGRVRIELDVTKLTGRARSLCVPIFLTLEERLNSSVKLGHTKALGLDDLEALVEVFRPHVLNGKNIWLFSSDS